MLADIETMLVPPLGNMKYLVRHLGIKAPFAPSNKAAFFLDASSHKGNGTKVLGSKQ